MAITKKIQIKNAIKWLDALQSEKYKQGKSALGDDKKGYCCWGVACKVLNVDYEPENGWDVRIHNLIGHKEIGYGALPEGLKFYDVESLEEINDDTNAGFKRLAKFLIKNADQIFIPEVGKKIQEHYGYNLHKCYILT